MPDMLPRCPKCQKTMECGHVPDVGHGQAVVTSWAPGAPERRPFWGGIKYRPKEYVPLKAFRCTGCGYVEFYAPIESGD